MRARLLVVFCVMYNLYLPAQETLFWQDPVRHLSEAAQLIDESKYNLAAVKLDQFDKAYDGVLDQSSICLGDAAYYRALIAMHTGNSAAEDLFLAYILDHKGHQYNNIAYYQVGDLYYSKKDYKGSLEWFSKVDENGLKGDEKDDFIFRQSYSYFALKNFGSARSGFSRLTAKPGTRYYDDAVYYSGMSSFFLKDYKNALEMLLKLENSSKYKHTIPHTITQIYFLEKQYDKVISYAEPKLQQQNYALRNVPEIHHLLGMAYFEQLKFDKAAPHLEAYIKDAKNVTKEDYYLLGFVYYKAGKYKEAIAPLQQLTSLNNALAQNAMYVMGQCYLKLGQKSSARSAFQSASRMDYDKPTKEESTFLFAKLSFELGFYNEALIVLRTFNRDFTNSRFAAEADDLLAEVFLNTRAFDEAISTIEQMPSRSNQVQAVYQKLTYYRAVEKYNDGLLDVADALLDKSLKTPQDKGFEALAYYLKGDIAHIKGNYDRSIELMTKFLPMASSITPQLSTRITRQNGNYTQGYNHFRKKEYAKALEQFQASFDLQYSSDNNNKLKLYPDAILRAADCYFMTRNYSKAKEYYDIVIKRGYDALDYAIYQKGIIEGLTGNVEEKLAALKTISKNYPKSAYADEALLESGKTLMNLDRNNDALLQFNQLIANYPNSENMPSAYIQLGLIAFNSDKYEEALINYQLVIKKYPKTPSFNEALLAIKDVYIAKGDAEGYMQYVKSIPNINISASSQDSLTYQSAESQLFKGQYDKALKGFDDYLLRFPEGYFNLPARFYRAECHMKAEAFGKAKEDYLTVLQAAVGIYSERAAAKTAYIYYYKELNWVKALEYYNTEYRLASNEEYRTEALAGQMRCNYKLQQYKNCLAAISSIQQISTAPDKLQTEAIFFQALCAMDEKRYKDAQLSFTAVISKIDNEWSAASRYYLARIHHVEKRFKETEDACFDVINNYPSYAYWLVKTYILLSDNYLAQGNAFQAKVTLESILDNYAKDDDARREAAQKYEVLLEQEKNNSRIIEYTPGSEMQFDDTK